MTKNPNALVKQILKIYFEIILLFGTTFCLSFNFLSIFTSLFLIHPNNLELENKQLFIKISNNKSILISRKIKKNACDLSGN